MNRAWHLGGVRKSRSTSWSIPQAACRLPWLPRGDSLQLCLLSGPAPKLGNKAALASVTVAIGLTLSIFLRTLQFKRRRRMKVTIEQLP
jgi:hypothetical protein